MNHNPELEISGALEDQGYFAWTNRLFVFHGFIYQASVTRMHCHEMIMIIQLTPYRGVSIFIFTTIVILFS
jgi:hypothetical protein